MKISRICLVGALIMAMFVAWTVATPVQLNGKDLVGGCLSYLGQCKYNSPSYQCYYSQCGYFHTCVGASSDPYQCWEADYCLTGAGCGQSTRQKGSDCRA